MKKPLLWSAVTFILSLAASAVGGRALWCDEILRINGQHYTINQLLAFKHLHDFCTQTPTGYLFMRPFQLLLGYEFGGCLVSALAAATITFCVLLLIRRFGGGKGVSFPVAAVVASNPLLVYYGSELAFYEMWAAAFAAAFALLFAIDDERSFGPWLRRRVGFVVAGSLFVTFHFAGMFVWAGLAAVAVLDRWVRKGFQNAFFRGLLFAVPMVVNLPMYLGAEGKAIHLGSQQVVWTKLSVVPGQIASYLTGLFPCFTGARILGVAVFAFGLYGLFARRETRQAAVFALGGILSIVLFLAYSGLHDYIPQVCRYWIYALAPTLLVVGLGLERVASARAGIAWALVVPMLLANLLADTALLLAEGRNAPYAKYVAAVAAHEAPVKSVAYVNHYESRFFGGYYRLPDGGTPIIPAYWEQGEQVRISGMRLIRALSPLTPVYVPSPGDEKLAASAGYATTNAVEESRTSFMELATRLKVFPEPSMGGVSKGKLLLPLESEIVAEAEKSGRPVFAPGAGWQVRNMPPRGMENPAMPFLALMPREKGTLRVYVPSSAKPGKRVLRGLIGSDRAGCADFGGKSVSFGKQMIGVALDIPGGQAGAWAEIPVAAGETFVAFASPQVE